jgi:RNase P subunit RPR2
MSVSLHYPTMEAPPTMARPICSTCGNIILESITVIEVRPPDGRSSAHVTCSDCATEITRRLSARARPIRTGGLVPAGFTDR